MMTLATTAVLLATLQAGSVHVEDQPVAMDIETLRDIPLQNLGKRVSICGKVAILSDGSREIYTETDRGMKAVRMAPTFENLSGGQPSCFVGIFERTDGLSYQEAIARGHFSASPHMPADFDYWLIDDEHSVTLRRRREGR